MIAFALGAAAYACLLAGLLTLFMAGDNRPRPLPHRKKDHRR